MDFSSYKTWERIILAVLAIGAFFYFISPSKEAQLLEKGKEFILRQVNSPSSTTFLSYNDNVEDLLSQWGVTFEEKHNALMIEFETTNELGGRTRKTLCIFYVNGTPVDYADADYLNKGNVHRYISTMKEKGLW